MVGQGLTLSPKEDLVSIEWSEQQKSIFNFFAQNEKFPCDIKYHSCDGNLVVRARAGTGKTTTILEAITYAPEKAILLAAFNKSIAEELKTKLKNPNAKAQTLHSVGVSFIYRNWNGAQLDTDRGEKIARKICGPTAPDTVVNLVKRLAAIGKNAAPFPEPGDLEDLAYQFDLDPDEWLQDEGWSTERLALLAERAMTAATVKDGTIDFDDMVFVPLRNGWIRAKYDLVVIDEAQDMNASQLMLAMKVCKPGGRVVVVGDDRQAIYGFRGADSNSIDRLKGELVAAELGLTITYRCPKNIVALASELVPDYRAAPTAPDGIVEDVVYEKMIEMATPGDFVLSRKNAPLAKVALRLLRSGKRAMVKGKDIGAGLVNVIKKVKGKGVSDFLARLDKWEEKQIERLKKVKKKSAEAKIQNVQDQAETLRVLADGVNSLKELEARVVNLFTDTPGGEKDFIVCSSVHKSKGLERDRVFVLTETLYPGGRKSIEEENIHYVAITRSKRHLVRVSGIS
jgi:superfamily I DNA/RNA helicase